MAVLQGTPPKKRGRPPKAAASDEEGNPVAKRSKSNGARGRRKPATGSRANLPTPRPPTQDALPARNVRNEHPAAKANLLPAPRRSSKQVAADREALRKAAEELVERGRAATEFLAQMQVDEERLDEGMEANIPQRLSAVQVTGMLAGMEPMRCKEDDEAESFESVSSCSEDDDDDDDEVVPAKPVAKKSIKKGATRAEINAVAERLRGRVDINSQRTPERNQLQFDQAALRPKKYTNSGLHPNARIARNSTEGSHSIEEAVIGGLTDDHAHATRPAGYSVQHGPTSQLALPERLQRDPSRKNEMVAIVGEYTDIALNINDAANRKPKGTCSKKNDSDNIVPHPKTDYTTQWMRDPLWTAAFMPSLSQALYVSINPFSDFKRESDTFLMVIQQVFDISFPHIQYTLRLDDELVGEACKRLNTRRSKIASDVLEEVKKFFKESEFVNKPEKIKDWAHWALRYDGPGFYLGPAPRHSVSRDHADYVPPTGVFQSSFIINVAKKYLRLSEKSHLKPKIGAELNAPIGLWGMLLLAVERAFTAYLVTGCFVQPPDFTYDRYWRELGVYIRQLGKLSERRWAEIINAAGRDDISTEMPELENMSTISAYRDNLYIPSTPTKFR